MSDLKSEIDSDMEQNYSMNSNVDPKNMQELTIYVSFNSFFVVCVSEHNLNFN